MVQRNLGLPFTLLIKLLTLEHFGPLILSIPAIALTFIILLLFQIILKLNLNTLLLRLKCLVVVDFYFFTSRGFHLLLLWFDYLSLSCFFVILFLILALFIFLISLFPKALSSAIVDKRSDMGTKCTCLQYLGPLKCTRNMDFAL